MENQVKQMKMVYTVVDRGGGKSIWVRIGVGFVNHDGSINLKLDAIPTNGSLQIRDWDPTRTDREMGTRPGVRELMEAPPRDVAAAV